MELETGSEASQPDLYHRLLQLLPPTYASCLRHFVRILICCLGSIPTLPENATDGDKTLVLALEALEAQDYIHACTLVNEADSQGLSTDAFKAEALNLRGTFKWVARQYHSDDFTDCS